MKDGPETGERKKYTQTIIVLQNNA